MPPPTTGSVVPSAVEGLKRQVGPLPLWMWGAGAIAAFLVYRYMTTGSAFDGGGDDESSGTFGTSSGIPSYASDGSIQAVDPATVQAYMGERGPAGPAGPPGTTTQPAKPTKSAGSGKRWWFNTQSWKWVARSIPAKPKTKLKKGYHWKFSETSWKWYQSRAMGGPFLGGAEVGEIGREKVIGVGYVVPSYPVHKSPANNMIPTVSSSAISAPRLDGTVYHAGEPANMPELPVPVSKVPLSFVARGYGRQNFIN